MINENTNTKTLEELEGDYWPSESTYPSALVKNIFLLRKKRLSDFDCNDLRILISQNIGLKYVVPKAIDRLKVNIFEEALYYPGDLLLALLNSDENYWAKNNFEKNLLVSLLKNSKSNLEKDKINDELAGELISSIDKFISSN